MSTAPEKLCPQSDISSLEGYSMNTLDGCNRLLSCTKGETKTPKERCRGHMGGHLLGQEFLGLLSQRLK